MYTEAVERGGKSSYSYRYLWKNSPQIRFIKNMLRCKSISNMGKCPHQRAFSSQALIEQRIRALEDNRHRATGASGLDKVRFPKLLTDPDSEKRAKSWMDYRPTLQHALYGPLSRGLAQRELLTTLHTIANHTETGHPSIAQILETAVYDERMVGVPIAQWDAIFEELDDKFLRGTSLDGNEDNIEWNGLVSRGKMVDLELLIKRLQRAFLVFKEVDFTSSTYDENVRKICASKKSGRGNFEELKNKFHSCLLNDLDDPERGVYLARALSDGYDQCVAQLMRSAKSSLSKRIRKENLSYLNTDVLYAAEKRYHREKSERPAGKRPATGAAARTAHFSLPTSQDTAQGSASSGISLPTSAPQRANGSDASTVVAAVIAKMGKRGKKHGGRKNFEVTDNQPQDSALRKVWAAAVAAEDTELQACLRDAIAEGQKGQAAAVLPATGGISLPQSGGGGYAGGGRRTQRDYGRKVPAPGNGLGNPHGQNLEWTEQQWRDYMVNMDAFAPLKDFPEALAHVAQCRPCDAAMSAPRYTRPATVSQDEALPIDNCAYCYFRPKATGAEKDESHPQNWRYGNGKGDHPERSCQAMKRAFVEGGADPDPPAEMVKYFHKNFVMREIPRGGVWKYAKPV